MYEIQHKDLYASCEVIEESSESQWQGADGEETILTSQYLITFRHADSDGGHYELVIQMEGNPGPGAALYQTAQHISWCTTWPLDMLAKGQLQDLSILVSRLTEVRTMVIIACQCDANLVEDLLKLLPPWDLPNGRYAIMMSDDKTEYDDENEEFS